jgi:predicted SprT family Zn-dependent metalloprotease
VTSEVCPHPEKIKFKSVESARKHAVKRALDAYNRREVFDTMYAYRCECRMVHLTSRKRWDGRRHIMLARIRAHRVLIEKAERTAYGMGLADGLRLSYQLQR